MATIFTKNVCRQISAKPMVKEQNATVHFVDDRYETVKAIVEESSLKGGVKVYMADWYASASHFPHHFVDHVVNLTPCLLAPNHIRHSHVAQLMKHIHIWSA